MVYTNNSQAQLTIRNIAMEQYDKAFCLCKDHLHKQTNNHTDGVEKRSLPNRSKTPPTPPPSKD